MAYQKHYLYPLFPIVRRFLMMRPDCTLNSYAIIEPRASDRRKNSANQEEIYAYTR